MENQTLKGQNENVLKFLKGFTWAVPQAYRDAIAKCQFEEGDIFYRRKEAYLQWDNRDGCDFDIIQVQSPPKSSPNLIDTGSIGIFEKNWNYLIDIRLISNKADNDKSIIKTTQGRLFTFLVHGNDKILVLTSDLPEIPIPVKDVKNFMIKNIKSELKITEEEANRKVDDIIINRFQEIIFDAMKKPNLFVMLYDSTNNTSISKWMEIYNALNDAFNTQSFEFTPKEIAIKEYDRLFPTITFKCIAIDSGKSEAIRDIIKKVLWPKKDDQKALKTVSDILKRDRNMAANPFKLSRHGVFSSFKSEQVKAKGIRTHSFSRNNHFVRYRVSLDKLINFPKSLQSYLKLQFTDCPNQLFINNDFSASKIKANFEIEVKHTNNHELINFAKDSRYCKVVKSSHENLAKYLLDNDHQSIACEVPVWIESGEFKDYHEIFKTTQNLTGHIDLLRYKSNGKIEIWDYKPGAFKEKKAKSQVFLYAFMLATRSGISLNNILCGYFDEIDAFYFEPSEIKSFEIK